MEPRIAMLSFSNFGSNTHAGAPKVKKAVEIVKAARPDLPIDGEMQADYAVVPEMLEAEYPWATRPATRTSSIFPNLQSANAAYKLLWRLAGAEAIGPILLGLTRPGARPPAGRRGGRHRQHGRHRGRGRAGEGRGYSPGQPVRVAAPRAPRYLRYPQLCSLSRSSTQRSPMSSR